VAGGATGGADTTQPSLLVVAQTATGVVAKGVFQSSFGSETSAARSFAGRRKAARTL